MKINHTMCISGILADLCVIKQKIKIKNILANVAYNVLAVKKILIKHKENYVIKNGKQSVKLKSGSIGFKNYFKKLAVPFKLHADFECFLKGVKSSDRNNNSSYTEKYQDHIPCSFAYKVVFVDNKFSKKVALSEEKTQFISSLKQFLMSMIIVKK